MPMEKSKNTAIVQNVIKEIREDIKNNGHKNDMLSFDDIAVSIIDDESVKDVLININNQWNVSYYRPSTSGNHIKILFKKVVRKLIKPIMLPVVTEQTNFNAKVVQILNNLYVQLKNEQKQKELLLKQIEKLEKKMGG